MEKENINFYKIHLNEIRKFKKESDYELFNAFLITANDFRVEDLHIVLLGFDDETEDETAMYSLTHIFARIYKETNKVTFFEVFLSNIYLLFPHAIGWCRTLFAAWNYKEAESLLFISAVKRHPIIIDKIISVYDFILNERDQNDMESPDADYVRKYKLMLKDN